MEYQDFTIDVRTVGKGRFAAMAVEAPIRESPRVVFSTPIPRRKLGKLLKAPASSTWELGQALYEALFQGKLGDWAICSYAGRTEPGAEAAVADALTTIDH